MEEVAVKVATFLVEEGVKAIVKLDWRSDGTYPCPGCHHNVPHFRRTLGILWGRHDQISCGCRLARQRGGNFCGCEYTRDE